jgi:hypothetical protein
MAGKDKNNWDVAVIGGGPAGMMAAGRAAELGAKVILLEKNENLGKKLLITGGGRCNVTNGEQDVRQLLSKFKDNDKFLFSPFSQWAVSQTLEFFNSRGMETKVEPEQRVFPKSNSAQSVWDVLVEYMRQGKVEIHSNSPINDILTHGEHIQAARLLSGELITANSFVIATGGTSRPETGSTGDGFKWLKNIGHSVKEPRASLVPISIRNPWVKDLSGLSMNEIKLTAFQSNVKQFSVIGKILFTHRGVSGPTILNMSHEIGELLKYGDVDISLDLFPQIDSGQLDRELQEVLQDNINKRLKNTMKNLVPATLASTLIELSEIDPETPCHSIKRESRKILVKILKDLRMSVKGLLGLDKAVITSGGVELTEVDFKSMRSRLYPNLYLVGDILNIDRPSGGYSLQLCWTTGQVAGTHAAESFAN